MCGTNEEYGIYIVIIIWIATATAAALAAAAFFATILCFVPQWSRYQFLVYLPTFVIDMRETNKGLGSVIMNLVKLLVFWDAEAGATTRVKGETQEGVIAEVGHHYWRWWMMVVVVGGGGGAKL